MFETIDLDGDGYLTCEEFSKYIQKLRHDHAEKQKLLALFQIMDTDLSGDLTIREIKKALILNQDVISKLLKHFPILNQALHPRKIQRLFLLVNKDDSEKLSRHDFLMLVKHVRQEYEEEQAFKRVYMCMDKDGDELLTLKEIKRAFITSSL